jgi:2-polyprenyl-3-methyl-5-hydroxy-6-metoxy-1,4-benzoquinol methylase
MALCTICNAKSKIELQTLEAEIYRCPSCSHSFSKIKFHNKIVYNDNYYNEEHKNWFAYPNTKFFEKLYGQIVKFNPSASILDAGCGDGAFLRYLNKKKNNFSLVGIDLHENKPESGIFFIKGDLANYNSEKHYDIIVSLATIEHFIDVKAFIKHLRRLCKPDGIIIIMTVNDNGLIYRFARILSYLKLNQPVERLYGSHHLNHFNISSLKKLMEINELKIITTLKHNFPIESVDLGIFPNTIKYIIKFGVWLIFYISKLNGQTFLQTVIARNR